MLVARWPPANDASDAIADEALRRYTGDTYVYIGDGPLGNDVHLMGDASFVRLLE